jgi:hypothetical protein
LEQARNPDVNTIDYVTLAEITAPLGLTTMGALHPEPGETTKLRGGTLVLLGTGQGFWPVFRESSEIGDGQPDPIDRWSQRVIGKMADDLGATACFPFGGPPHAPFVEWALKSGWTFPSPTGMLVHDSVGLMISYRGALHFEETFALPEPPAQSPCDTCQTRPCLTACPVSAFSVIAPYDLAACHAYLDTADGGECLTRGCIVRRACPVSDKAARKPAQSALHMKAFHPT